MLAPCYRSFCCFLGGRLCTELVNPMVCSSPLTTTLVLIFFLFYIKSFSFNFFFRILDLLALPLHLKERVISTSKVRGTSIKWSFLTWAYCIGMAQVAMLESLKVRLQLWDLLWRRSLNISSICIFILHLLLSPSSQHRPEKAVRITPILAISDSFSKNSFRSTLLWTTDQDCSIGRRYVNYQNSA